MAAVSRSSHRRRRERGITLVELLIALAVFGIIAALASAGIAQVLRVQSLNEANASLQGKLRRITEVVSQDLRSALLGVVVNAPYASDGDQVSFALAVGGQGFEVRRIPGDPPFPSANGIQVFADAPPAAIGQSVMILNAAGEGSVARIASVTNAGSNRYDIRLIGGCTNQITFTQPMRAFLVDVIGYRLDGGDLVRQRVGAAEEVVAFDIDGFELNYAYRDDDNSMTVLDAPRSDASGTPLRVDGTEVLESLRVRVRAEQPMIGNRMVERTYVAQVALPPVGSVNLRSVVTCP